MKKPDRQPTVPHRERGFTLIEIVGALAFTGAAVLLAIPIIQGILGGGRIEQAHQQLQTAIVAAQRYRAVNGDYQNIDVETLVDNGYVLPGFDDGDDENVFGLDLVISPTTGGADAEFDYETDNSEACEQLESRITGASYVSVAPACDASNKLEFTIR